MTPTEAAYVGGIIDGEGHVEFKWADRTRKDRKGTPTYRTLIVRLEVPQVDKRLIDYLMEITRGRNPGYQTLSQSSYLPGPAPLARWVSWRLPSAQAGLPVFNCEKAESKTQSLIIMTRQFFKKVFGKGRVWKMNRRRRSLS